ncbi:MAG: polymer-forming cytoskeletal protein [Syntrophales bacterium]
MKVGRDNVSIVNKDCYLQGNLEFSGYLIIAGNINGILNAETVVTREGSHIVGEVKIKSFTVAGSFEGELTAENLTLLKTADVRGKIRCGNLVVEEGGLLNGDIKWLNSDK